MGTLRGTTALALVLGLVGAGAAQAQEAEERDYAENEITVTATRLPSEAFEVPSTVTVIDAEEIEENLVTDIKDLIRFEPGISVPNAPSRFGAAIGSTGRDGNAGFNIRGLGGNRVLLLTDGVRVPDGFGFGPSAFGRGDYVDLDLLQSVEVVRGPASALYGSDGLAGVVSFITKDPSDFLAEDEIWAARARVGYASADDSYAAGLTGAVRFGDWSALVAYTHRDAHEQENQGENEELNATRTAPNPQDITSDAVLGRIVFEPSAQHRFRLTGDYGQREVITEAYSGRTPPPVVPPPSATSVIDLDGVDESERRRATFDYTYENGGGVIDSAFAAVYYQTSELSQFSDEDRFTAADRTRLSTFENEVWGGTAQAVSSFTTGAAQHRIVYGGDYSLTRQEGLRDGTVPPVGEPFPSRPFPNTDYTLAGAFVQDEISFMDGRVVFFPALRYDYYDLSPEPDALFTAPAAGQSDSRVTPRFGVVAWPTEQVGVFFNYAQGFKAPSPSQVNNFFANPIFGYTSIPNPDLQPETSESVELGLRLRDARLFGGELRASTTTFMSSYEDFIEQVVVGGSFTPADPAIFQFVNLGEVDIWGWEARSDVSWDNGFGVTLSASFAEGDQNDSTGDGPLQSVDPWKIVAGLSYDEPDGRWGGQLIATHSSGKDDDRVLENSDGVAGNDLFTPEGFTILDLTAYWHVTEAASLRVGVFNVTDEHYWWWSDVRGLSAASAIRDAYTQPGRNFSASISYRF
ncbi:MAG TPA: TonB-dependent hemoglobin/transferrin/lactoferrin family receptor [Vitreimonas sp.]|uniref:TonB-dependent hemoglobin/transferrin/lactoferrin family receptor n=1 Tax=Vitreimonas sp. TaxID=3069702 RepID=UPI002D24FDD5|nr:TonB-dependent hemoglobin/transferrin/lactoferrin family receptor [Vitreimonas sp.]HYD88435.1 TonB-dependent hemoglobin/transferrin/lactoferrin family receptor [Vitreimonas sp.]